MYNANDMTTDLVESTETRADDDGTYFRNMITDEKTMLYSENRTEYYTLLLTFPVDYKDSIYSGIPELIEINILSRQILDSDN